ncbi:MAG: hypothetical protein Q9204_005351 [Flavoplaca sp. TL-2023a]
MSSHADFDANASKRSYTAPYNSRHPVPTIQDYEDKRQDRDQLDVPADLDSSDTNEKIGFITAIKEHFSSPHAAWEDVSAVQRPYESENRYVADHAISEGQCEYSPPVPAHQASSQDAPGGKSSKSPTHTSETIATSNDPRERRKVMKKMSRDNKGREVTDPVTHFPIIIHDATNTELKSVPENEDCPDRGADGKKCEQEDAEDQHAIHSGMEALFPPPSLAVSGEKLASILKTGLTVGLGSILAIILLSLLTTLVYNGRIPSGATPGRTRGWGHLLSVTAMLLSFGAIVGVPIIIIIRFWVAKKVIALWEDELWAAAQTREDQTSEFSLPESAQWLNSLLASVWPLINPDLFTSLADTVEDVMQTSCPKFVRMIAVSDLGQGNARLSKPSFETSIGHPAKPFRSSSSAYLAFLNVLLDKCTPCVLTPSLIAEAIRILGIKWLPGGHAKKEVLAGGRIQEKDRDVPNEGDAQTGLQPPNANEIKSNYASNATDIGSNGTDENESVAGGMDAEEGSFVNVEIGFSYRASKTSTSMKVKAKNAHLYLLFYLPGGIRFPVWVELRGMVGTLRMRLQLCPDPPFVALCTMTLLGQPKVSLSCTPLTRKGLNIMDLPLISSFVQSSIDAALAEYVAPKSLSLDLKDMLVGDDFKKNTSASGVLVVTVIGATGFKEGDRSLGLLRRGSSDAYVAVGWGKFGKPIWSTRIILDSMSPSWNETAYILVGPEEINASERLRVQLWDSDRASADDDLGRIEVDLEQLMGDPRCFGRMWQREDGFRALTPSEDMPGTLVWRVGYFPKKPIQREQLERQTLAPDVKSVQQLKEHVTDDVTRKLREASDQKNSEEFTQQEAQDLKIREDNMIAATHPLHDSPTGILSLQIHQITGLELELINKPRDDEEMGSDTAEGSDELPSSYCTVILNHQKIFKTRTKPKSSTPFFNAGTERFVRDVSREFNPSPNPKAAHTSIVEERGGHGFRSLGLVYLPLQRVFKDRSQVVDYYPIVGGIGYGRIRISLVFRSVQLHLPPNLLGWDSGTIEVTDCASLSDKLPAALHKSRLKVRTSISRGKMRRASDGDGQIRWQGKRDGLVSLAVQQRYRSCLVIEFRINRLGRDQTPAFAVLWLQNVIDEQKQSTTLPVYGGDLKQAESNYDCNLGKPMGSVMVTLRFRRGLGRCHHRLEKHNSNVHDVMEVLSTAMDNKEVQHSMGETGDNGSQDSSSSESSESSDSGGKSSSHGGIRSEPSELKAKFSIDKGMESNSSSPLKEFREYSEHSDQLHRHHRGLMQWKGARTAKWMKTRIEDGKDKIANSLKHQDRNPGIETEV